MTGITPNHRRKQLLVGVDAMEWTLVERWAAQGKLPTLRRLIEQGTRAVLESTALHLPDTVWVSCCTGTRPGKFANYFYVQYDPRTQGLRIVDDDIARPAFWEHLSDAGVRVGVVDVPKFGVSPALNGIQLANWGAHATRTARAANPAPLLGEIDSRFGQHAGVGCDAVDAKAGALRRLRRNIVAGARQHGEMFRWLMREHPCEVFFAVFSAPHCAGHHFWPGAEEARGQHAPALHAAIDGAMEEVYRAVDRELGAMIELAGPQTQVMVFAGHGMGPLRHASWNLPEILDALGYGRAPSRAAPGEPRNARVNPWRLLRMTLPGALQYRIKAHLPRYLQNELLFRWYSGRHNWAGARAFAVPNTDSVGAIRLAVKGRDRFRLIEPGEEYRRVCDDIADALHALTDPASGRPVVQRVTAIHDTFHGPFVDGLPDLTVLWDQSFRWTALQSPRVGTLRLRTQDLRTGGHTAHGFLLAMGPDIAAGQELTGHSILDIVPTVLATAGVAPPPDLDGRALRLQPAVARR